MIRKTAVILINTGTPDSPAKGDVKRYLKEFLSDGRVISIPAIPRMLLVHGIIAPFRAPKSAGLYRKVWTEKGSPLLWHAESLREKLQTMLGNDLEVIIGMRYGNPSLKDAIKKVMRDQFSKIVLLPLFPQYASSTTGSAVEFAMSLLQKENSFPDIRIVGQFYNHPGFISCFAQKIREHELSDFDHVLFSYHSLPLAHLRACHQGKDCSHFNCVNEVNEQNSFCYHATCMATTRLLAEAVELKPGQYSVGFQSRFSKNWLSPFSDQVVKELAIKGVKKLLVVCPSFVTDCLETIVEIGDEYREIFKENGGEHLQRVDCLNDMDPWIETLTDMIKN